MNIHISQFLNEIEIQLFKTYFLNSNLQLYLSSSVLETEDSVHCFLPAKVVFKSNNNYFSVSDSNLINHLQLVTNQINIKPLHFLEKEYMLFRIFDYTINSFEIYTFRDLNNRVDFNVLTQIFPKSNIDSIYEYTLSIDTIPLIVFYRDSNIKFAIEANEGWDSCLSIYFNDTFIINNIISKKFSNSDILKYNLLTKIR